MTVRINKYQSSVEQIVLNDTSYSHALKERHHYTDTHCFVWYFMWRRDHSTTAMAMSSEREKVECVWLFFIANYLVSIKQTIFRKILHHISHHFSHRSTQRGGKFPAGPRYRRIIICNRVSKRVDTTSVVILRSLYYGASYNTGSWAAK